MELTVDSILRPNPEVIHTTLYNREAVLLHMPTATYYSLNSTGARIWRLMGDGLSLGEIAQKMVVEYDVTPSEANSSVLALAARLIDTELGAVITDQGGNRRLA